MPKVTKEYAQYQDHPKGDKDCDDCTMWRSGKCTYVEGTISPEGYCRFFKRGKAEANESKKFGKYKPKDVSRRSEVARSLQDPRFKRRVVQLKNVYKREKFNKKNMHEMANAMGGGGIATFDPLLTRRPLKRFRKVTH